MTAGHVAAASLMKIYDCEFSTTFFAQISRLSQSSFIASLRSSLNAIPGAPHSLTGWLLLLVIYTSRCLHGNHSSPRPAAIMHGALSLSNPRHNFPFPEIIYSDKVS